SAVRTSEAKLVSNCVKCGKCARHCPQHIDIPERLDDVRRRFQPGPVTAVLKAFGKTRSS
ncbi:MAG: 4Fe-4S dicluster domain-containing protein, partial [Collinsella sp.]